MEKLKVYENLFYELSNESLPLFHELKSIILSLMEYKPAEQALIKRKQRDAITQIITLQTNNFFCVKTNQLAEFFLTNNNIHAYNTLIYHTEVPIDLHGEDYPPTAGGKTKVI